MQLEQKIKKLKRFIVDPEYRFQLNAVRGAYNNMADDEYLTRLFKFYQGYPLNLQNPRTFNEKLQWIKLYDRNPLYTQLVDKFLVREFVKEKIGEDHLIPLIGVWDTPEEIDFDALPDQFVLKCNHNSGTGMCICKDKSALNIAEVKDNLWRGLKEDYYLTAREWPYKNVPRKIICEKFMVDESNTELKDYKFYCFNGKAQILLRVKDRFSDKPTSANYYSRDGQELPIKWGFEQNQEPSEWQEAYDEMFRLADILASGIPQVRVDFYLVNGKIYFGEMTFFDGGGFDRIEPVEWDYKLGDLITLPDTKRESN